MRDSDLVHFFWRWGGAKIKIPHEISQPLFVYLLAANSDGQTKNFVWTIMDLCGQYLAKSDHTSRYLNIGDFGHWKHLSKNPFGISCAVKRNPGNWTYWNFWFLIIVVELLFHFPFSISCMNLLIHHTTSRMINNYQFFVW